MKNAKQNLKSYLLVALFLANILIWFSVSAETRSGLLSVAFLDIGQGDAIFIEAPNGRQMLIDGGPGRSVLQALGEVMPFYDRSIDFVIETHPDRDHIGGLPPVFERYDVSYFLEPGVESDTGIDDELRKKVKEEGAVSLIARRGMVVHLSSEVTLTILYPDRDVAGFETNRNDSPTGPAKVEAPDIFLKQTSFTPVKGSLNSRLALMFTFETKPSGTQVVP